MVNPNGIEPQGIPNGSPESNTSSRTMDENRSDSHPFQHETWWDRYSPNFEAPSAGVTSLTLHLCLVLLLPFLIVAFTAPEKIPPAVEVVQVYDDQDATGEANDPFVSDQLETQNQQQDTPLVRSDPVQFNPLNVDLSRTKVDPLATPDLSDAAKQAQELASAVAEKLSQVKSRLNTNLGGNEGTATSTGTDSKGSGRAGRAARWILHFEHRSAREYLKQMEGLGAGLAFPEGSQYRYFTKLVDKPSSFLNDLSKEKRIYWIDEDRRSVKEVAEFLDIPRTKFMIAFLPIPLEQKMLRLELAYKNAKSEDDILQTEFKVVTRGRGYDVIVIDQRLRK